MTDINIPTSLEIFEDEDDDYKSVSKELDDSWRHGNYVTEVFRRKSDNTFWMASYRVSGDGETHELREGLAQVDRVYPHVTTVTKTEYKESPQEITAFSGESMVLVQVLEDYGRMGEIEALFVTTRTRLEAVKGFEIYLGEVLGKHSDISITLDDDNTKVVSEDQNKINWLVSLEKVLPVGWDLVQMAEEQKAEKDEEDTSSEEDEDSL